jgi:7-cyano-7-deazaguanine tRNA-ribosyltransferase
VTKDSGLFFYNSIGLCRPEVVRHRKRISTRHSPPEKAEVLVLLPQTVMKPFSKSHPWRSIISKVRRELGEKSVRVHVCTYAAPFGVVPHELDEVYPLSQHETAVPLDSETIEYVTQQVATYVEKTNYKKILLFENKEDWGRRIANVCSRVCRKKNVPLAVLQREGKSDRLVAQQILDFMR